MKQETIKLNVMYYLPYIPQRCRKTRYEECREDIPFKVKSITSEEAPIAFVLSDYHHVSEETPIVRCYKGKLYMQYMVMGRYLQGHDCEDCKHYPQGLEYIRQIVHPWLTYDREERNKEFAVNAYKQNLSRYILIDGYIWARCGEPRYCICTFGLGHNHGGTGLFVETYYNPHISKRHYFNAFDYQKAIDTANAIAQGRGDTKDVGRFEKMIDVVMPSMVKVKPKRQHGNGDKFINTLNAITENAESAGEAGLLCMIAALAE